MAKVKVVAGKKKEPKKKPVIIDSLKRKLGAKVYVGSTPDQVKKERDSLRIENAKLKIEIKKK